MSDDNLLKQAVLEELKWEPSVNAAHIGVTTKIAAERAARQVKGVKAVAEQIEVRHGGRAGGAMTKIGAARWRRSPSSATAAKMLRCSSGGLCIAMGNASAEVQRAADFVTDSNCEDGFANAIERFILGHHRSNIWVEMARAGDRAW